MATTSWLRSCMYRVGGPVTLTSCDSVSGVNTTPETHKTFDLAILEVGEIVLSITDNASVRRVAAGMVVHVQMWLERKSVFMGYCSLAPSSRHTLVALVESWHIGYNDGPSLTFFRTWNISGQWRGTCAPYPARLTILHAAKTSPPGLFWWTRLSSFWCFWFPYCLSMPLHQGH